VPLEIVQQTKTTSPITDGDAGIVIKANGEVCMFNTFGVTRREDFTPQQLETGARLVALMVALRTPQIMAILEQMAQDPDIVGEGGIQHHLVS
jgi:hypothetical protein